jgi:hypothetical protein
MARAACFVLVVALGATPDITHMLRFAFQQGQPADPEKSAPQGTLPSPSSSSAADKQSSSSSSATHGDHLSDSTRLAIIRAISGEFVRAQVALPGGKQGFHVDASKPFVLPASKAAPASDSIDSPHVYVATRPPVIHQGDHVQITRIEFREKAIVLDVNGGGKVKWHWRDHIELGMGGGSSSSMQQQGASGSEGQGATIFLDFEHRLPDITPEEVKHRLAPVLDFSRERSASTQYAEALPPEFQQAIKNRMAAVGMDHEMVLAAMGRPDKKVRERDADGNDTEDWIYGGPTEKTVFVTFIGEKVVRVRQF